jgi:butyryl-CoA dehydrogenase
LQGSENEINSLTDPWERYVLSDAIIVDKEESHVLYRMSEELPVQIEKFIRLGCDIGLCNIPAEQIEKNNTMHPINAKTLLEIQDEQRLSPITPLNCFASPNEIGLIKAEQNAGKTLLAMTIAVARATEISLLKFSAIKPERVCYFDFESGSLVLRNILRQIYNAYKLDEMYLDNLYVFSFKDSNPELLQMTEWEQKKKFIGPLVGEGKTGCFGLTEPGAGSDAAGQQTEAVKDGDVYTINGSKIFTTNAQFADTFIVFAMTDKSQGTKGISAFVIDGKSEGITVGENIRRCGIRGASNCEVFYENVRVPAENRIGNEGDGFKIAMMALDGGRIGVAAQALGIAQGALDLAIAYVKEREQFGRPIVAFQNTQFKIAELQTYIDAARLMVYKAAQVKSDHEKYGTLAAQAKLFASKVANDVTRDAVQMFGGYGFCREYEIERKFRDAKITEIYEGTSEIMKVVIGGSMRLTAK